MQTYLKNKNEKGFTLLFAVLVSTLVISIGATIISIALRQTILSGTSRESQYAFYAANTVLECATYWDKNGPIDTVGNNAVFPVSGLETRTTKLDDITCSGINITDGTDAQNPKPWVTGTNETTFYLEVTNKSLSGVPAENYIYCAQATVYKELVGSVVRTTIEAKGYNTCDELSPRRVERGLIVQYES